ncbi:MAG: hypothetical protein AAGH90_01365 [Pseudomonadota bacterium]
MKQHVIFALIAAVFVGGLALFNTLNPPPPADYRIVYLGSPTCGSCKVWKATDLQFWKRDPASKTAKLELAILNGSPFNGGYGRHDDVFKEAFEGRNKIIWPSFAVYNHGEFEKLYVGRRSWQKIEDKVRKAAEHAEKVQLKEAGA